MEAKKYLTLGAAVIILGLLHSILFYRQGFGLNVPLFIVALLAAGWILIKKFEQGSKVKASTIALGTLTVFFSVMVFVRASELLTFFNIIAIALLLLMLIQNHTGKQIRDYLPEDYLKVFALPFDFPRYFKRVFVDYKLARMKESESEREHGRTVSKEVIRGSLIAIVAVIIFAGLFSAADAVFARLLGNIFSFDINPDLIGRSIIFVIVAVFLICAFGYLLKKKHSDIVAAASSVEPGTLSSPIINISATTPVQKKQKLGSIETTIVLVSVSALFLVFILLQLAYLFGGESHLMSLGLTYAEYARKGFFELIWVAILTYALISFAEKKIIRKSDDRHLASFKIICSVLIIEVVIILASAFFRLWLYEFAYGFSTIRLYSHALMIWLGVVFVLLALHILKAGRRTRFGLQLFISVALLLISMNFLNPDAYIASKNIERYAQTGKIDVVYIAELSDDAVPVSIWLLNDANTNIRAEFVEALRHSHSNAASDVNFGRIVPWQSSHLSSMKAAGILMEHKGEF